MKKLILSLLCLGLIGSLAACGGGSSSSSSEKPISSSPISSIISSSSSGPIEEIDYADKLKLDMTTSTIKQEVTVKTFIDGDTTHFNIDDPLCPTNPVVKVRFLGVDTPESTGKIEPWGKKASNFTKGILSDSYKILLESNDDKYNPDSTGGRYLMFVWYKTSETADWRCLDIELLQNGLALPKSLGATRYSEIGNAALNQAKTLKKCIWSNEKDPDYYYGKAQQVDLKELRTNLNKYIGTAVSFDASVVRYYSDGVYVENFDSELNLYFGFYVYYGKTGTGISECLNVGNRCHIVGTVTEFNGSYQISGCEYSPLYPGPDDTSVISEGTEHAANQLLTKESYYSKVTIDIKSRDQEEEVITPTEFRYTNLVLGSSVSMEGLYVSSIYTTTDPSSSSVGAMTLTCYQGEDTSHPITIRTNVLRDPDGSLITKDRYLHKNINVTGVMDSYNNAEQILAINYLDLVVLD